MKTLILAFSILIAGCTAGQTQESATLALPEYVPDLEGLVSVRTPDYLADARKQLIRDVFGTENLPSRMPDAVDGDTLTVKVSGRQDAVVHYFRAGGEKLAIYHAGHNQAAILDGRDTIREMLQKGYDVLAIDMPPEPHDQYRGQRLGLFLEPIAVALNYATSKHPYRAITMTGLSGGGWATVLYAAVDPRVTRSMPVAGSLPFQLRDDKSHGDYEQTLPFVKVSYADLYLMGTDGGRSQVQVFNRRDRCCFSGIAALAYRDMLHDHAHDLGGEFDVLVVESDKHETLPAVAMLAFSQ